jgi:sugar (pentulose or hexulose) kinase
VELELTGMDFIITVDIGTTSVKVGLFDKELNGVIFESVEYELVTPKNDYVELNPQIYWASIKTAISNILDKTGVSGHAVKAIAMCSQGETLIPIDQNGNCLHNAIVWIDSRASKEAEFLSQKIGSDTYYRTTGLIECSPADPISKLMWIKNNYPQVYENTYKFLLLTDYIAYLLCGKIVSEWTMMCSTGYYDINKNEIWKEILDIAGIDHAKIPTVEKSGTIVGTILPEIADELSISAEAKVIISGGDQMCGAVGGGNIFPGTVTETTGTALALAVTLKEPNYDLPKRIVYYKHVNGNFLIMPYVNTASIILKWFKDEFCEREIQKSIAEGKSVYTLLGEMAKETPVLANGLMLYPHFAGKNSPNNDPNARGAFLNVGLEAKKGHFVRAIFEGVAYMLKENLDALKSAGIIIREVISLGGGSKSDVWNQIKADVINMPIITLKNEEAASLGVACLAAVALGWFNNLEDAINVSVSYKKRYYPIKINSDKYKKAFRFYSKMDRVLAKLFQDKFYE